MAISLSLAVEARSCKGPRSANRQLGVSPRIDAPGPIKLVVIIGPCAFSVKKIGYEIFAFVGRSLKTKCPFCVCWCEPSACPRVFRAEDRSGAQNLSRQLFAAGHF